MPELQLITFDCAETLLKVGWQPSAFALDCAAAVGLHLEPAAAKTTYERILGSRWRDYQEVNKTRDVEQCLDWWRDLTNDWLDKLGHSREWTAKLVDASDELLYNPANGYFAVFDDVIPTLDRLKSEGYRMAVISNWDYSLHRILRSFGLYEYFEVVLASLEEGVEKPETRLFEIAAERTGVAAAHTLHIGDNPLDDVHGARQAGMRALLIDRSVETTSGHVLARLTDLFEHAEPWTV